MMCPCAPPRLHQMSQRSQVTCRPTYSLQARGQGWVVCPAIAARGCCCQAQWRRWHGCAVPVPQNRGCAGAEGGWAGTLAPLPCQHPPSTIGWVQVGEALTHPPRQLLLFWWAVRAGGLRGCAVQRCPAPVCSLPSPPPHPTSPKRNGRRCLTRLWLGCCGREVLGAEGAVWLQGGGAPWPPQAPARSKPVQ